MSETIPDPTSPDFAAWFTARQKAEADANAAQAWAEYEAAPPGFARANLRMAKHDLIERGRELASK